MSITSKALIITTAGALALTGCVQSQDNQRTQIGAATGAVLGGLFGASRDGDNNRTKTVAGAVAGAVIGGAIGQMLDQQQRELQQNFSSNEIDVINTGSELIVRMPEAILFDFDSAALRPSLARDLNVLSGSLLRYPDSTVFVVGHTDNVGTAEYNQNLSQRRAQAVASQLIAGGVSPARIIATGQGENQPIASNLNEQGRALNRRVDITIRPNAS